MDLDADPDSDGTPLPVAAPCEGVQLYWYATSADDRHFHALAASLSAAEHARAARYGRPALARRYVVGRARLRGLLGALLALPAAEVPIERGARGRPRLAGAGMPDFNVSNTLEVALVGITTLAGVRIGVDVEHGARRIAHDALSRKFCTPGEQAAFAALDDEARRRRFLRLWTCKEAMSKATGEALGAPLRHLDVALEPAVRLAGGPSPYVPGDWTLDAVAVPGDYVATVALWRADAGAPPRTR